MAESAMTCLSSLLSGFPFSGLIPSGTTGEWMLVVPVPHSLQMRNYDALDAGFFFRIAEVQRGYPLGCLLLDLLVRFGLIGSRLLLWLGGFDLALQAFGHLLALLAPAGSKQHCDH